MNSVIVTVKCKNKKTLVI